MRPRVLDLSGFFYFVQVVDRGGFTAAGPMLRIPKSPPSHGIPRLETELGVRLLNRTSRRFAMTDAGEEFYRHAVVMLRDAELAESAIRHRLTESTGTVRCTVAMATMQFAIPLAPTPARPYSHSPLLPLAPTPTRFSQCIVTR